MQIRQRLAMRRLEEVLACQQRERQDQTFFRSCLFCRYQAAGNRAKLIHHLYMIHHLNLGSPDNLVFVNEYLDILDRKLRKEVNPNNDYYDKFYVINYLELGKKWIEVLAEDFEDTMPTFMDSEEEEEDEFSQFWCLISADHGFDLKQEVKDLSLSFYERVKFVNYIRACCHDYRCFTCGKDDLHSWAALSKHLSQKTAPQQLQHASRVPDRKLWDKDEFLIPTFENDALLCRLDDLADGDEDADDDDAKRRARRSLPPDPAILDNGPLSGDASGSTLIVAEDPIDVSQSILNDKDLRQSLNVMENF
uniref:ZN622/Rei1/Reh1 zinc finger C2H2-type domain-containing protein n=1 Tax=Romanomermis culicivorax TaxID=13658 RepID=A0A915JQY8_ROMCU